MISVGILVNRRKDKNHEYASMLYDALKTTGAAISADTETAGVLGVPVLLDYCTIDILFVLGGDGTILRAAAKCAAANVKIIGINLGSLGFLTETQLPDIRTAVEKVVRGEYHIERRMMLDVQVLDHHGQPLLKAIALNDAVVNKMNRSRLINLEVSINGQLADSFAGDGVIISTPTGSTAYSLSAGGPIICPTLECMMSAPICAHTLYSRTIVFKPDDIVEIKQKLDPEGAYLSLDGTEVAALKGGDFVRVTKSKLYTEFIRFRERYFYSLLRSKFITWNQDKE